MLAAHGGDDDEDPTRTTLSLQKIGSFDGGAVGTAGITEFDAASKRLFVVNGANGRVEVLDLANPAAKDRAGYLRLPQRSRPQENEFDGCSALKGPEPASASFVTYLNTRDGDKGDLGPEGLALIPANRSPNGKPLLVVGNEVSGTTAIMQINLAY